jgi:hypothetical protein
MVVNYLNFKGISVFPTKAYSPLFVNPDTVLALPGPNQSSNAHSTKTLPVLSLMSMLSLHGQEGVKVKI